jgi:predicted MPP superfamily phosphohydrolase
MLRISLLGSLFLVGMGIVDLATAQSASAYWINSFDTLFSGNQAQGQIADIMMENDRVAFVISAINHSGNNTYSGGNILDAGSSTDRIDALGELYTYFDDNWPRQAIYDAIAIMDDGTGGGPAIVRLTGADSYDPQLLVTTDYSLAAADDFVSIKTTVTNTGIVTYTDFELGSAFDWGNCLIYAPGHGFSMYGLTTEPWLAGTSGQVSYGYVSPDTTLLWGTNGSSWSDINVGIAILSPGDSCTYNYYLVVGGIDIASVATGIHEINYVPVGSLYCSVTTQSGNEPVIGANIDVSDNLGLPYLQMVTDSSGLAFSTIPHGNWILQTSAWGYLTVDTLLSVPFDTIVTYTFVMEPDTTDSEPTIYPIGDTLTIIQRPLLNIPAIALPGDTLVIECEADPSTSGWTAELLHGSLQVPLVVSSSTYDQSTLWWTITALIPNVPVFELYDLVVTASGDIEDTTAHSVHVIPEFMDDYYFIHITDTHLPTRLYYDQLGADTDTSEIVDLRNVIKDINIIKPEFVLITGDFLNEGELEDFLYRRYFSRAQRLLTEFKVPVFLLAGNHDIGGWSSTPPPAGTARQTWWRFFGWKRLNDPPIGAPWYTQNYSFDYGPVHYIGLEVYDNYEAWRHDIYGDKSFTAGQLQWLANDLNLAANDSARVLFYHYDFSQQIDLGALGVEMALWGHTHQDIGDITIQPYNLCTNNVCEGECAYRLIRVSNGTLNPSATVSAGYAGGNLQVDFQPANDGSNYSVTAQIENLLNEQFEHSQLQFLLPSTDGIVSVDGGTLIQIIMYDSIAVYYVGVDIQPSSSQSVTITLDTEASLISEQGLPVAFALHQNYPNPFNPTTTFKYELPKESKVVLSVFDINGRLIETLVNEKQQPGYYSVQWDACQYSSGVYIYRIQADGFSAVKKCILMK